MTKKKLGPPTGLKDWWNDGAITTTPPHLRKQSARPFTAQEARAALKEMLQKGFC